MLPAIPSWGGLHPFAAHFPIALLMVAPVLVMIGLLSSRHRPAYWVAALLLMVLGTLSAGVAASTGQDAAHAAEDSQHVWPVLQHHEELSEVSIAIFTGLTLIFALLVFMPRRLRRKLRTWHIVCAHVIYLLAYAGGCLVLMHAGHEGGRLVHEFGIHAEPAGSAERRAESQRVPGD